MVPPDQALVLTAGGCGPYIAEKLARGISIMQTASGLWDAAASAAWKPMLFSSQAAALLWRQTATCGRPGWRTSLPARAGSPSSILISSPTDYSGALDLGPTTKVPAPRRTSTSPTSSAR
jgi:hypothetical protein